MPTEITLDRKTGKQISIRHVEGDSSDKNKAFEMVARLIYEAVERGDIQIDGEEE